MAQKFLVVVEPNNERHHALERVLSALPLLKNPFELTVLVTVNNETTSLAANNPEIYRDRQWFLDLIAPLDEMDADYDLQISWSNEYQHAVLQAAEQSQANMIVVPVRERPRSGPFKFSDAKWALLRGAPCPVMIVQPCGKPRREVVLAAVHAQGDQASYEELNETIIDAGKLIAGMHGATLHLVNAYKDQEDYPDRARLVRISDLPNEQIHSEPGATDEVIASVAKQIDADVVVLGTRRRSGLAASMRGNTSERVIQALDVDVFAVN
jgi:universal stress protein E